MKPKLEAILFDMGGTLIEFENSTWDVLNQRCARDGYDFLTSQNRIRFGYSDFLKTLEREFEKRWTVSERTLQEIDFESLLFSVLKKLDVNLTDGNKKEFMIRYYQPVTQQITLVPGAVEALRFFKDRNLKIGLLSNTIFPKRFHAEELKRFGLERYLDLALFSSELGFKKPHPRMFCTALEKLSTGPHSAVFVGDRLEEDIEGAHKVGMNAILKVKEKEVRTSSIVPDAQIKNLTDLPGAVLKLFEM